MKIGVLALQGAFREHLDTLQAIGVDGVRVREPRDLEGISGLILPGGESTTMRKLIDRWGMREPILALAASGAPIFGTCAGMILLAREIAGGEAPVLPLLDVTVERNAFGRQQELVRDGHRRRAARRHARPRPVHPGADHRAYRPRRRRPGPAR